MARHFAIGRIIQFSSDMTTTCFKKICNENINLILFTLVFIEINVNAIKQTLTIVVVCRISQMTKEGGEPQL